MLVKGTVRANPVAEWHMDVEMADGHSGERAFHELGRSAREWEDRLGGDILKEVSRSFYLTLQLLPKRVRGPICLGYLLARTSDTIADTESVAAEDRLALLDRFRQAVNVLEGVEALQADLQAQFQPRQSDPGEKKLLDHTMEAVAWLNSVADEEQQAVRLVLKEILHGQSLDCERFGNPGGLRYLADPDQLEEYTYLVAGSVGEFWTRLCFLHWEGKFSREDESTMMEWARAYGRALQLINILRDLPKDLENGRCYFPLSARLQPDDGGHPSGDVLLKESQRWEARCQEQLEIAMRYCRAVRPARLRYATVLPLLLAERTLAYLRPATWEERQAGVKVKRDEVKAIMKRAMVVNLRPNRFPSYAAELREWNG